MLFGRETELRELDRLLSGARVDRSGVLALVGEPGIGKTALLAEVLRGIPEQQVLRVRGSHAERDLPFAGLHQLLGSSLELLSSIPAPQEHALSVALALEAGGDEDRLAVGAATLSVLSRRADDAPIVVVVEDAHALDRPSAEALAFAARRLVADRIALLITARPESDSPLLAAGLPRLDLAGLGLDAATALLRDAGSPLAPDLLRRLHEETQGNPLALLELAGDADRLARWGPHHPVPAPEAVCRSFGDRLDQLDPDGRLVLLILAVCDGDLAVATEVAVALGVGLDALQRAERLGLVTVDGGVAGFRHPLVRATCYGRAAPADRRRVHAAVADALPPSHVERRTWHRSESVVGADESVAEALDTMASRYRGQLAFDPAAAALTRASELSPDRLARGERLVRAAENAWLAGRPDRATALLERIQSITDDPGVRRTADLLAGHLAFHTGTLDDAVALFVGVARASADDEPERAVMALCDAIDACCLLVDASRAVELAGWVSDLLGTAAISQVIRIRGTLAQGIAETLAGTGGSPAVRRAVEDLLALPTWGEDAVRPAWTVMGPLFLREQGAARTLVDRVLDRLRATTALGTLSTALTYTARADATGARWESATVGYREAVELSRELGLDNDLVMALAGLACIEARTGAQDECRRDAEESIALARRHHNNLGLIWAMFALGELDLAHGRAAAAAAALLELRELQVRLDVGDVDLDPGPELAEALLAGGDGDAALAEAEAYAARAANKGQPWALARAERALAITAPEAEQQAHFEAAMVLHRRTPDAFERARTELARGVLARRRRHRVQARPWLRSALDRFEELGARPWADRAARELTATGQTVRRRADRYLDVLTAQEVQVARLLGRGKTTREAAAALFLSPKTIEYHLRHVYTKLGIHSRQELMLALRTDAGVTTASGSAT